MCRVSKDVLTEEQLNDTPAYSFRGENIYVCRVPKDVLTKEQLNETPAYSLPGRNHRVNQTLLSGSVDIFIAQIVIVKQVYRA